MVSWGVRHWCVSLSEVGTGETIIHISFLLYPFYLLFALPSNPCSRRPPVTGAEVAPLCESDTNPVISLSAQLCEAHHANGGLFLPPWWCSCFPASVAPSLTCFLVGGCTELHPSALHFIDKALRSSRHRPVSPETRKTIFHPL